jgi:hypothetical protein
MRPLILENPRLDAFGIYPFNQAKIQLTDNIAGLHRRDHDLIVRRLKMVPQIFERHAAMPELATVHNPASLKTKEPIIV